MGLAVGCIGMSQTDFERCTPVEFSHIARMWHEERDRQVRTDWERVRAMCQCFLQPHCDHVLRAEDVMRFSWEGERRNEKGEMRDEKGEGEDLMARFRRKWSEVKG